MKKSNHIAYLYLLLVFGIWGSLYVVSKFVLGKIPTFTILFLRFLIASISLYFILGKKKLKRVEKGDYKYIALVGIGGYFISVSAQLIGTKLSSASYASLVNSLNPVVIMIMASIILKEKLTLKKIGSIVLALIGVYLIIGGGGANGQIVGIVFSIFSVLTWSLVSVFMRKVTQKYDSLQITLYGLIIAALCNLPISISEMITSNSIHIDIESVIALLYMSIICTGVAYVLWNKSLSILEAGTCSAFYPVQPLVSILLGIVFLGETITTNIVIGAILIIAGVLLSLLKTK
ncbi:DMT family transporter [Anaeromicropila herbilytica]|uniref:Membrane protein n=1 Tax=Anaeromicropila herbilytica TaxID=2785025 RepID=A0A7R7EJH7_9FIRM|nr:EamA family transporter [Anaeromicropila herbilytica]BCN29597.1 membrane protein [Anaeromicropila herbilytica]